MSDAEKPALIECSHGSYISECSKCRIRELERDFAAARQANFENNTRADKAERERDEALFRAWKLDTQAFLNVGFARVMMQEHAKAERERDEALAKIAALIDERYAAEMAMVRVRALIGNIVGPIFSGTVIAALDGDAATKGEK